MPKFPYYTYHPTSNYHSPTTSTHPYTIHSIRPDQHNPFKNGVVRRYLPPQALTRHHPPPPLIPLSAYHKTLTPTHKPTPPIPSPANVVQGERIWMNFEYRDVRINTPVYKELTVSYHRQRQAPSNAIKPEGSD